MLHWAMSLLKENRIKYLQLRFVDNSGIMRAKTVLENNFHNALTKGINFSKTIMSSTSFDRLIEDAAFDAADGDFWAVPDLPSLKISTYQPDTAYVYCDLKEADNCSFLYCHRTLLKNMSNQVQSCLQGTFAAAFEPEFMLSRDGVSCSQPYPYLFSVRQLENYHLLLDEIANKAKAMGLPLIQISSEASSQQFEINLAAQPPVEACDNWLTLREMIKVIGSQHGYLVTFLPKPCNGLPGNGLHLHLGLTNGGQNLFSSDCPESFYLSEVGSSFLGGLISHSGSLAALGSACVNSYKRLTAGNWAPTHVNWGIGNRASFIRIPEKIDNIHLEIRSGDATCNPYLFMSGILAAGLLGVKTKADPGRPCGTAAAENRYPRLPGHLGEAMEALEKDAELHALLGKGSLKEYIAVKRAEWYSFLNSVSDWDKQFISLF